MTNSNIKQATGNAATGGALSQAEAKSLVPAAMTREQQFEQRVADARAEIAREWQRLQDWLSAEAARIEDRVEAHRQDIEHRLATADARVRFILDRVRAILASDGNDAEKLAEVEHLGAELAAGRSGVGPTRRIN